MEFFDSHRRLFGMAFLLFTVLTFFVAILPALDNQSSNQPLATAIPLSESALRGKNIYISNGCVGCHTQQVRSVDMDRVWGDRPGMAADYADHHRVSAWINTATLMGTERTGPDLSNVGKRQPSVDWNLIHLYNPRAVVKASIMPAYPWLFEQKTKLRPGEVLVNVPSAFKADSTMQVVASRDALDLVAYLVALKQAPIPVEKTQPFLYARTMKGPLVSKEPNATGKLLYTTHCQSCHQSSGLGLPGAFPPLKGSKVVQSQNLELYIDIIMHGYDAREEYGVMPAVGSNAHFTEKELTAIINYERTSWGNSMGKISEEDVKKIMDTLKTKISK